MLSGRGQAALHPPPLPCRDPLLVQLSRWLPGINPTFRLAHNMSSAAEAALGLPTQAATGARGLQGVWQTQRWQGVSELTCWNPPHKEAVRGTDASQFRCALWRCVLRVGGRRSPGRLLQ